MAEVICQNVERVVVAESRVWRVRQAVEGGVDGGLSAFKRHRGGPVASVREGEAVRRSQLKRPVRDRQHHAQWQPAVIRIADGNPVAVRCRECERCSLVDLLISRNVIHWLLIVVTIRDLVAEVEVDLWDRCARRHSDMVT